MRQQKRLSTYQEIDTALVQYFTKATSQTNVVIGGYEIQRQTRLSLNVSVFQCFPCFHISTRWNMETCLIIQMSQVVSYSVIRGLEELKSNQKFFSIQFFLCLIFSVCLINFLFITITSTLNLKKFPFLKKNFSPIP